MEIIELILGIISFLLSLTSLIYQVYSDLKRAAAAQTSDGSATK